MMTKVISYPFFFVQQHIIFLFSLVFAIFQHILTQFSLLFFFSADFLFRPYTYKMMSTKITIYTWYFLLGSSSMRKYKINNFMNEVNAYRFFGHYLCDFEMIFFCILFGISGIQEMSNSLMKLSFRRIL